MMTKKRGKKSVGAGFEESLKKLEELVETLERGDVPLNDVMRMYEEGVMISKQLLEELAQAENRLKRLSKDVNGNFELLEGTSE